MATSPHQTVTKPKGLTGRSLAVDSKELIKSLGKGIVHLAQNKWEEVAIDAVDAVTALGISNEPSALGYILIRRAATAAMFEIVGETVKSSFFGAKPYESTVEDALDYSITEHDIPINKAFFERPLDLEVVQSLQELLGRWLSLLGVASHMVETVLKRFPSYFLYSLNEEWRMRGKMYEPLLASTETPFNDATERQWAWRSYSSLLQFRIEESIFEEAFSLNQVYVPLRAYYETSAKGEYEDLDKRRKTKNIVDLEAELISWLGAAKKEDAIRIISGGPGSGKSSFTKVFAAHIANSQALKVLFIPLHLIDPTRDLIDEVGRFVLAEGVLTANPLSLENGESDLLIIFDGLDELASQGKAAVETARSFVREVELTLGKRNSNSLKLRVIISGREIVVQDNEAEFSRRPHQLLTLLPYFLEKDSLGGPISDPKKLLPVDQRREWWSQYGRLTGQEYKGLPKHLDREDLLEITSQPLLNYLVALSYTRKHLDFSKDVNINQVYGDLVSAVHERAYEKKRPYVQIRNMTLDNFERILEEVGLASWHGDGRTTTVREIEQHCTSSGLGTLLEKFEEGAKAGVTRLLAAFFFRQYGRRSASGDATFVFTHKSFGEYLTARRIVRAMMRMTTERKARTDSHDAGWDERQALHHWVQIAGSSAMTPYLVNFVRNELALRGKELVRRVQLCFAELFGSVLRNGLPMEMLAPRTSFREESYMARNAEESLLVCMSACARVTRKISPIIQHELTSFGTWFKRVQGQRKGHDSILAAAHLDYLDLKNSIFFMADFYGCNLSYSNLTNAKLTYANFGHARLIESNLSGVFAHETAFHWVAFRNTNLNRAKLEGASFRGSVMRAVKLDKTLFSSRQALAQIHTEETNTDTAKFADEEEAARIDKQRGSAKQKDDETN
jgi:hypothetical protein